VTDPSNPAMQDASSDRSRSCTSSLLTSRLVRLTLPSVGLPYAWRKGVMDAPLFRLRGPHSSIPDAAPDRAAATGDRRRSAAAHDAYQAHDCSKGSVDGAAP
jgi:hypothetical protein